MSMSLPSHPLGPELAPILALSQKRPKILVWEWEDLTWGGATVRKYVVETISPAYGVKHRTLHQLIGQGEIPPMLKHFVFRMIVHNHAGAKP